MIRSFRHRGLRFEEGSLAGVSAGHAPKLRRILAELNVADRPQDLNRPGYRLHALTGDWRGFWSIRVSANQRLIFRFAGADAVDVDLVDYH